MIDQFGWLHADKNSMTRLQFLGLVVMLAGTIIINRS
ncbi:DMT family transporter [Secundilactobacillus collinoides]